MRTLSFYMIFYLIVVGDNVAREGNTTFSDHNSFSPLSAINPDQTVMDINNLTVWVREDGFHDWVVNDSWNGTYPVQPVGMVFSEGMVWGGLVNDGITPVLRVGGSTYLSGNRGGAILTDIEGFVIGAEDPEDPLVRPYRVRPDWETADLKKDAAHFFLVPEDEVTESQIEEIRTQYESDWNEWPAEKGAPFDDVDGNGFYDPSIDIPGIPGADQTLWIVYNDLDADYVLDLYGSPPIGLEVQETYWAYYKYYTLTDVVFKRVRFIYKGTVDTLDTPFEPTIDSMYIAQWSDPDLGSYINDYVGCDTVLDLGYVYNGFEVDLKYLMEGFSIPPAGGYTLVQGPIVYTGNPSDSALFNFSWRYGYQNMPMSTFIHLGSGNPRPSPMLHLYEGTLEWFNLLRACEPYPYYPDCLYILDEWGNPTHFELAGDPVTGSGDLDGHPTPDNPMRFPPGDRRLVMAVGPFNLARGDTQEVIIPLMGAFGSDYLSSVAALKGQTEWVKYAWASNFTQFGPGTYLIEFSVPNNSEETGPFEFLLQIEDDPTWEPEVSTVTLHYNVEEVQDSVEMVTTIFDTFIVYSGSIPAFPYVSGTTELHYYLSVDYDNGMRVFLPMGAPLNQEVLIFGPDTSAPSIVNLDSLPDVFFARDDSIEVMVSAVDDRFPIQVTLHWNVNHSGDTVETPMRFDSYEYRILPFIRWKGQLHEENLSPGDSVFYWITATDSSLNQNVAISDVQSFAAVSFTKVGNWEEGIPEEWDLGSHWTIGMVGGDSKGANISGPGIEADTLTRIDPIHLNPAWSDAYLTFRQRYLFWNNIGYLELKVGDGPWEILQEYTSNLPGIYDMVIPLKDYIGLDPLFIRFRVEGDGSVIIWWIDEIFLHAIPQSVAVIYEAFAPHNTESIGPFALMFRIWENEEMGFDYQSGFLHYGISQIQDSTQLIETTYNDSLAYLGVVPEFEEITGTTELQYYVTVDFGEGGTMVWPSGAPSDPAILIFGPDTTAPIINEVTELGDVHYLLPFEKVVRARVTDDRYGVTVRLRWRVGYGPYHNVAMEPDPDSSGYYVGILSDTVVTPGDSVWYTVKAIDESMNENTTETEQKWFYSHDWEALADFENGHWEDWDLNGYVTSGSGLEEWGNYFVFSTLAPGETDTMIYHRVLNLDLLNKVWITIPMRYLMDSTQNVTYIETSTDGQIWTIEDTFTGSFGPGNVDISLIPYVGMDSLWIRFRRTFNSESFYVWIMDDIILHSDSTRLSLKDKKPIPKEFVLYQNYPNPFNPVTTIRYDLPVSGKVELVIYDILGREVDRLVSNWQEAGSHKVLWDASNVASGIYFYRLTVNSPNSMEQAGSLFYEKVKKLVVLK